MGLSARRIRSSQTVNESAFGTASTVSGRGVIKNIGVWSSDGEGGFELVIDGVTWYTGDSIDLCEDYMIGKPMDYTDTNDHTYGGTIIGGRFNSSTSNTNSVWAQALPGPKFYEDGSSSIGDSSFCWMDINLPFNSSFSVKPKGGSYTGSNTVTARISVDYLLEV